MCTEQPRCSFFRASLRAAACAGLLAVAACATRVPPPMPAVLAHPELLYPRVPVSLMAAPGASRVDIGWRYLQANDLRNAEIEFNVAADLGPGLYPARTGQGYVAFLRRDYERAIAAFDAALALDASYVPALVGRGQALLAADRPEPALAALERALSVDPSLADVNRRVEVLRFRTFQTLIDEARAAATAGRMGEARGAYERALAMSPESGFLHRELGLLERRAGNADQALRHLRQAIEIDPGDGAALVATAELLESRGDAPGAEEAYRQAAAADPSLDLAPRIAAVSARARELRLPPQFRAALTAPELSRGDLAALVGVRLGGLLERAPSRQVVVTDAQGHWAATWINQTASTGIIEPFENHTFQPSAPVRRGDLATVASRLVSLIASSDPAVRERLDRRPAIADVTAGHLQYDAVASVVAAGVMPLLDGERFQVGRHVTGEEAVEVIDRVRLMAASLGASRP